MALPTIQERLANLSAVGFTKEAVFGTPVAATNFVPDTSCTIETDPGLFYPQVMQGQRDVQIWGLYGEYKHAGHVAGPLFPVNGIPLFVGAIGVDGGIGTAALGNGVVGSTGAGGNTTSSGTTIVGANTINVTAATGFATNQIIQIDVNASGVTSSECRKITGIAGTTLTLDVVLNFPHASGVTVKTVIAPYTHIVLPANALPSFTIEKNIGGAQSLQYAGCRVNKFDLKAEAANQAADFTADVLALSETVLSTPTAISVDTATPFVFAEYTLSLFGQNVTQANKFSMMLDNGVKATYTMAQVHGPSFVTPITRKISGQITVVFTSLNDVTWGYFQQMINATSGQLQFTLAHPAGGGTIQVTLPQVKLSKYQDDIKVGDVVMSTLHYEAEMQLSSSQSITGQVINSAYLPH